MGAPTSFTFPLWGIFPGHDFGCFLWAQQRPSTYCYPVWLPTGNHLYTSQIHCHSYVHQEPICTLLFSHLGRSTYPGMPSSHLYNKACGTLALHALWQHCEPFWVLTNHTKGAEAVGRVRSTSQQWFSWLPRVVNSLYIYSFLFLVECEILKL